MSKEASKIHESTEKKYKLGNYEKTQFFNKITKEITKFDKKLKKIENHEKLKKEGKTLSKEVDELISKKQDFKWHVELLKKALELCQEGITLEEKNIRDSLASKFKKDYEEKMVKRLSYFFAAGRVLAETRRVIPRPLDSMWDERQKLVNELYGALTDLPRGVETSLAQEAKKSSDALKKVLKDSYLFLEELAGDKETIEKKFVVKNQKEEKYAYDITQSAAPEMNREKKESAAQSKFKDFFELESEESEESKFMQHEIELPSDKAEEEEPEDVICVSNKSEEEEEFETVLSKQEVRRRAKEKKLKELEELQAEMESRGNIREEEDEDTKEEDYIGYNTEEEYGRQRRYDEGYHPRRGGDFRRGRGGYRADRGRGRYSRANRYR
eukprot:TRINITY_DN429_c0_g1_i2.p1 TRINITY_DN429_c0_g1~~TRINITY_DN429_c0_g1_i2.p1  ORF type:complete len:384 (-),score=133.73 TRINITY_DN429_c0_g1_i2:75-1226(-)